MKITLYTITDCKFSQSEKEYLQAKNIQFEEKNLESNREFLTEMLSISNNFAGTPVTKIEKDDGQVVVLKGFTKEEFDKVLGQTTPAEVVAPVVAAPEPAPIQQPVQPAPVVPQPPTQQPVPVMPQPPVEQMQQPAPQVQPVMPTVNAVQPPTVPPQPVMPPQQPVMQPPVAPPQPAPAAVPAYQPTQQPMMQTPSEEALSSVLQDLQTKVASEQPQQ